MNISILHLENLLRDCLTIGFLDIYDESGLRIAEVQKTLYIRRKKSK